ncbi:hypothetical protein ACWGH8_29370 [Nonomuraea muscovyensis]|uniref:Tissue inhibitor of metalloproteinase n=1 Tax=Nonomuraea muscovyensis TaxID=1124761 RepID=A0A7X0EXZ6_9ACTN|nr:hypothetical protein [Nonomuraea muscovyensis]MBB6345904.1 hypothetical protein [Nonomuraea muscovyensis]
MTSRILFVLALLAGTLVIAGGPAAACSCARLTPKQRVAGAAAVFTGTVTEVRLVEPVEDGGKVTATLRADQVYKGEIALSAEVSSRVQGPACGFPFRTGERYLIFAHAEGEALTTSSCSGNLTVAAGDRPLRTDGADGAEPVTRALLAALGSPRRPPTHPPLTWSPGPTPRLAAGTSPDGPLLLGLAALAAAGVAAGLVLARRRRSARR